MGKKLISRNTSSKGKIKAKIDVPGVVVDISTKDSLAALREVRKILESLRVTSAPRVDEELEELAFEQKPSLWSVSDEARTDREFMEFIRLASTAEEHFSYKRIAIANKKVIDTIAKKAYATVEVGAVRDQIKKALYNVKAKNVKYAAVHVMGDVSNDEKNMVCDVIADRLGKVEIKKAFTQKDILGKTVAELLIFGKNYED